MNTNGPASGDIKGEQTPENTALPFALIKLTPEVVDVLAANQPGFGGGAIERKGPSEIRFGVGDVVTVTIFEAAAGGLFIPTEAGVRPGNYISLPNQSVDSTGNISVPYAGTIPAKGRTPSEVQQSIVNALKNRAIEPQAVVALADQRTSLISVLGEVNAPARFPVNANGERLLDVITRAGGPKGQGFDTWVMLERGGKRYTLPFGSVVYEPGNNVYVQANDTVYVYREPQNFVAFGASGQQGLFNFEAWRITLAEAVAKAGGLNDSQADPASVFIYRSESREVARKLGIDVAKYTTPRIPIVYNVNFRDPSGYFLATKMQIRNKDVVYASNAQSVETSKFLQYVRLITATVNDPMVTTTNAWVMSNTVRGATSVTQTSATSVK